LTVADVKRAFAAEGVPVQAPFDDDTAGPTTMVPRDLLPSFAVIVYGPEFASGPVGLRFANADNVVARVRNVLISYPAAAPVTGRVQSAIERLRRTRKQSK
jgi:hypothetical protein